MVSKLVFRFTLYFGVWVSVIVAATHLVLAQSVILLVNAETGTILADDSCPMPRDSEIYAALQIAVNCAQAGGMCQAF